MNWLQSHAAVQPLSWFRALGKDLAARRGTEQHVVSHLRKLGIAEGTDQYRAAIRSFQEAA